MKLREQLEAPDTQGVGCRTHPAPKHVSEQRANTPKHQWHSPP